MLYTLVRENSHSELERKINLLINKGWIPQGGIAVSDNGFYVQAMIKHSILK
jgi:hypothetical protein